jgi:hypothetical protein
MGVFAEMLAAAMNPNLAIGEHSAMYVENQVLDWFKEFLGYPADASGILLSGGSMANFTALSVARNNILPDNIRKSGLRAQEKQLVAYCSTESHSCIQKSIEALGIGTDNLRKIPVNEAFQIDVAALKRQLQLDKENNFLPFCIVGNAGTVNTGAIDPLDELLAICQSEKIWFHVDGAFGALAKVVPSLSDALKPIEEADSVAFDLHKWMCMPYEAGCVLIKNKKAHRDTFALNPVPQMVRPLVDLYSNKDSFTGAPIETSGMERLSKEQRIAEKTSPLAIALSKVTNVFLPESAEVSPVQTDYAIKSYFGWLGGTASATSHYAVMPFSKSAYPDQDWKETMSLGFIKSLPTAQSKYVTAFYENNKEISQAYADMRHFMEIGEMDKAQKIMQEKGDQIALAKFYDKASKDMSKVRQVILHIRADDTMNGAQKKEEIDRLKILIGEIAQQMEESRKSLSQR